MVDDPRVTVSMLTSIDTDVAALYDRVATGRLVILGDPGGGKTGIAILLLLALCDKRRPRDRVPVWFTLATWEPDTPVEEWMSHQLATTYGIPVTLARQLVDDSRILPVLDGLDEIPADRRLTAMAELRSLDTTPLVITCRTVEYTAAIADRVLAAAAVVEVIPVDPATAAAYLTHSGTAHTHRWDPIIAALYDPVSNPCQEVLRSPLMLSLARTVYQAPASDPAELAAYLTAAQLEDRLLDALIPAVYGRDSADTTVTDARRWLSFFADNLPTLGPRGHRLVAPPLLCPPAATPHRGGARDRIGGRALGERRSLAPLSRRCLVCRARGRAGGGSRRRDSRRSRLDPVPMAEAALARPRAGTRSRSPSLARGWTRVRANIWHRERDRWVNDNGDHNQGRATGAGGRVGFRSDRRGHSCALHRLHSFAARHRHSARCVQDRPQSHLRNRGHGRTRGCSGRRICAGVPLQLPDWVGGSTVIRVPSGTGGHSVVGPEKVFRLVVWGFGRSLSLPREYPGALAAVPGGRLPTGRPAAGRDGVRIPPRPPRPAPTLHPPAQSRLTRSRLSESGRGG